MCKYSKFKEQLLSVFEDDKNYLEELFANNEINDTTLSYIDKIHLKNGLILEDIMNEIGWPSADKVGEDAMGVAWYILQNSISTPQLLKSASTLIDECVNSGKMSPIYSAFLSDRIAFYERKPQKYGTQFDWNEDGEMVPWILEDDNKVDIYRESVGLAPLKEQIAEVKNEIFIHKIEPPKDLMKQKRDFIKWLKKVGWVK